MDRVAVFSYEVFLATLLIMNPCSACISFDTFATCSYLDGVASLPLTIETLVLKEAKIERLPSNSFSHLTNMAELNIKSTYLGVIEEDAFADIPRLNMLSISSSDISIVETGAFNGLRNLSLLNIEKNRIDNLKAESFSNLKRIENFVIKSCNISLIDSEAFHNVSSVTMFQFYNNNVTLLKEDAFSAWKDVSRSTVNENTFGRLECFSGNSFSVALSFSFNRNYMDCSCHVAWMLSSPLLNDKLLSNMCHDSDSGLNLGMTKVSMDDLNCPANPTASQLGCNSLKSTTVSATTDVTTLPVTMPSTTETLPTTTSHTFTTSKSTAADTTSSGDVITSNYRSSAPSLNCFLTMAITSLIVGSPPFL